LIEFILDGNSINDDPVINMGMVVWVKKASVSISEEGFGLHRNE
jgi:hypothetical protein